MSKKLSAPAIHALEEALYKAYWYKDALKRFLIHAGVQHSIINQLNWQDKKRQIVIDLISILINEKDQIVLLTLCSEVTEIKSFAHLECLEDGARKSKEAKAAIEGLQSFVKSHQTIQDIEKHSAENKTRAAERLQKTNAVKQKLCDLNSQYMQLLSLTPQKKGFKLEPLMYDIFNLFDLDPKASFKIAGEQIDGAFYFENTHFIFEAKWQNELTSRGDLDVFSAKIKRKLDNTLGLFLSMNGYIEEAINLHSGNRPVMILIDGGDLMAVLEGRISLDDLLRRKKNYAALTGRIYLPFNEFLK
ncbi:MAG: hypothetical protein Q7V63_10275 [Gammaproteobacteria bacterium]|nr:hypothetical protein [Gammaproteobacteria bacterium]